VAVDPKTRGALAKEGRLWMLSLVCAAAGATGVAVSDSLGVGVMIFLLTFAILGPALLAYERRRRQ
jgi:Flp pilus assembly protein TadB